MEQTEKLQLRSSPAKDATPEMGIRLGRALAMEYRKVVVGMDLMKSSPMMKNALISGLISSGADVIDVGTVSEPVIAMAARMGDCAVYVNEFRQSDLVSGYLLIDTDGSLFGLDRIRHIEGNDGQEAPRPSYKSLGTVKEYYNATKDYNDALLNATHNIAGGSVILNCNCGLSTDSAPQILNSIKTDVICINAQKDPNYITNPLSIKEADIRQMRALVEANAGSIGISLNRVGNLMRVFDESGEPLNNQEVLGLLIMFLKPKKLVVPLDVSNLIPDIFTGKVTADVNSPHPTPDPEKTELIMVQPSSEMIFKAMKESGAELAYYDGGFVFNEPVCTPDAMHAAIILSQFTGMNDIRDIMKQFPEYYSESKSYKFSCSREDFIRMMNANVQDVGPIKVQEDGCWRIDMNEGAFFVAFDNDQEDAVNVVAESSDRVYLISMIEVIDGLMESCSSGQ